MYGFMGPSRVLITTYIISPPVSYDMYLFGGKNRSVVSDAVGSSSGRTTSQHQPWYCLSFQTYCALSLINRLYTAWFIWLNCHFYLI